MGKKNIHEKTIDWLVERLLETGKYKTIQKNVDYSIKKGKRKKPLVGEIDVLAQNHNGYWHFYEIKSTYNPNTHKKAKEQYRRYCRAFPNQPKKGVYVTPTKILRLPQRGEK